MSTGKKLSPREAQKNRTTLENAVQHNDVKGAYRAPASVEQSMRVAPVSINLLAIVYDWLSEVSYQPGAATYVLDDVTVLTWMA
ncbi:hypothetical protein EBH_0070850 [Eimeria brunetti]|uniref:Uncharacterized protein n=1 Tax=Eimeria brunetti TaxID=51314 RepID=U6LEZ2_9EIME|nr:hypothetical protein EBH_0070850 [Eimeria brunetti]